MTKDVLTLAAEAWAESYRSSLVFKIAEELRKIEAEKKEVPK